MGLKQEKEGSDGWSLGAAVSECGAVASMAKGIKRRKVVRFTGFAGLHHK